ncbi:MAG: hypothetical protein WD768_23235 [Phycisphaeraceae bacterium]
MRSATGNISLCVAPAPRGPNLNILAELLNSSGTVIASSNPTDLLTAGINASVAAGTYFLRIRGVGKSTFASDSASPDAGRGQTPDAVAVGVVTSSQTWGIGRGDYIGAIRNSRLKALFPRK